MEKQDLHALLGNLVIAKKKLEDQINKIISKLSELEKTAE